MSMDIDRSKLVYIYIYTYIYIYIYTSVLPSISIDEEDLSPSAGSYSAEVRLVIVALQFDAS